MNNTTKELNLTSSNLPMEAYDALPKAIRLLLQDAPFNFSIGLKGREHIIFFGPEPTERLIIQQIPIIVREGSSIAYGPDHPQAREDYQYEPITPRPRTAKRIPIR